MCGLFGSNWAPVCGLPTSQLGSTGRHVPSSTPHFELIDGVLLRYASAWQTVARHTATGTRIVQMLPLGDRVVVREHYRQFPKERSNLNCLDAELCRVWTAELPWACQ